MLPHTVADLPHTLEILPSMAYAGRMPLEKVAVLVLDRIAVFELGTVCEVFGTDRSADGFPVYDFAVCSIDGRAVRTGSGFDITPTSDLKPFAEADLIAVPAHPITSVAGPEVVGALRAAHERGAIIVSVCSGAFVLGEAGLLDGRRCTTHWKYADELQRRFPSAQVDPGVLYVDEGSILTSAGTAAGVDLLLHLVRREQGTELATKLARRMVVPPHRDGGQSQYIDVPLPEEPDAPTLTPLLQWLGEHLEGQHSVDDLAARVYMAPRTFARRFKAETGTTPHEWLTGQRVLLARRILEGTDLTIEAVATRSGFGDAATLRHHFARRLGVTPQSYRTTFRTIAA
jgi:AraC family transcriptional regulator, transcriptional activator FtrA